MRAEFEQIKFNEPQSAEANLAMLESRLAPALWRILPTLLAQVPSPDDALNFLERFLRAAPVSVTRHMESHPPALLYLLSLFSHSRFLSESLLHQPELILWLDRRSPNDGLQRLKTRDDLTEEYYRFSTIAFDTAPSVVLSRFKRREYLRITLRDVLGLATLTETTLELSDLADVLIERALRVCAQRLENEFGRPQSKDVAGQIAPARLTVLSLGKLGGQELNYSSDVDLMFLYDHDGQTAGGKSGEISNLEFFVRLAQAILKMLTDSTPEGSAFRIDLRLRPEGGQADVAVSLAHAIEYYRTRAREWELQMLIKARVSAGEAATGEAFLHEIHPLIFRREFHFGAVEAMRDAREGISGELRRKGSGLEEHAAEWNVKLSPGGIRDIEFLAQCLQRLHGGREPWLTGRGSGSTLVALQRLHDKGLLSQRDFFHLGTAYQFLRKVEHRLQLTDGLQEHTLPSKPGQLNRLARRCGIEATANTSTGDILSARVRQHFENVRAVFGRVLPATPSQESTGVQASFFATGEAPPLVVVDALLQRLKQQAPRVAAFLKQCRSQEDSFARRGAERFLESAALDESLLEELDEHPDWLERAQRLFARSDLAADMLAREPRAITRVIQMEALRDTALPFPETMASLRNRHREKLHRIVARSTLGEAKPFETFADLTRLAEEDLRGALSLAIREELPDAATESSPLAVIALGRLGSREFDLGSDADLVFIVDSAASEEDKSKWRKIVERFLPVAGSYTQEGLLLPIDTRLRPRGGEGEIVQSASYLLDYFRKEAEGWEAATYLKARTVGVNCEFGQRTLAELRDVLLRRFSPAHGGNLDELRKQLVHMRKRLEQERPEGPSGFKTSPGGYFDIDYIVAFITIRSGLVEHKATDILSQIGRLEASCAIDAAVAKTLRDAATFYRSLDHAIRVVLGRTVNQLPEPAQIPRVTALLKQWGVSVMGDLRNSVITTRRMARDAYEIIVIEGDK